MIADFLLAAISCLDPSIAMKPVFERFSSVVITSGTISPLDMYPKMLQFTPVVQESYSMTLTRNSFLPLVRVHYRLIGEGCLRYIASRSSREVVTRWQSAPGSKSGTTLPLSAISEASSLNIARLYQMGSSRSSQAIFIWRASWQLGMIWFVWRA